MPNPIAALQARLRPADVVTDPDIMRSYQSDRAPGLLAGTPVAVVFPRSVEQVADIVRVASDLGVPLVPRGAGSGLSGGANAVDRCIVVVLDRMNRILEIDAADSVAVVEPGVLNSDLRTAARKHGLWYAPDPASRDFCTLGGNVATNAGGLCCVKYGVTRDAVLGLQVVLADGSVTRVGHRSIKGVAGYDLTGLMVGSEGTLGLITEITLRLLPLPAEAATIAALMPNTAVAAAAVQAVLTTLTPSLFEMLDNRTIRLVEDWKQLGLDVNAGALLIAQTDRGGRAGQEEAELIEQIFRDAGANDVIRAETSTESDLLLAARRFAFPAFERLGRIYLEDVAVPRGQLVELVSRVEQVAAEFDLTVGTFGHVGDGNMHPVIVVPDDETGPRRAQAAFKAIMDIAIELAGTVTGEHGVGLLKRDGLSREQDDAAQDLQRRIKHALDPQNLFNPGKSLPVSQISQTTT